MRINSRSLILLITIIVMALPAVPQVSHAQGDCGSAPAPRLAVDGYGRVSYTSGLPLNVRDAPTIDGARIAQIAEGIGFLVLEGPVCADNIHWWRIQAGLTVGWAAEGLDGEYFVEPVLPTAVPTPAQTTPEPGPAFNDFTLSPIQPAQPFVAFDWAALAESYWGDDLPDPTAITLPAAYNGDLPPLPIDLSETRFLEDAGLNDAQIALLAQNGFVVVPGGFRQFHEAYSENGWDPYPEGYDFSNMPENPDLGHAFFVTTDSMLHLLHFIFDNLLADLERAVFYEQAYDIVTASLQAAHNQAELLVDTPLAQPAYNAELYLAVALELLEPGAIDGIVTGTIAAEARAITVLAEAAEGRIPLPFTEDYIEDFSQYRPRGHYDEDELLERYFRGMMWLSRITFRANSEAETQTALLLLHALRSTPWVAAGWQDLHDTLSFLIGPVDDLGPPEYTALADEVFGALSVEAIGDAAQLAAFQAGVGDLPGPRINGLILPPSTEADEMADVSRGFRFLGQRFTFDAYVMQQLMYPFVGTREQPRILPLGLDVAAALGSDTAYSLAEAAGATAYANYDSQLAALRQELAGLDEDTWQENVYSSWLWALQPLWGRDPAVYPPLMNTDAWLRRDLQTGLASWTELKHDTVLYAKQAGGLGGGGAPPPETSFGYVEPNPLVFARIAIVAGTLAQGLAPRTMVLDTLRAEEAAYAVRTEINQLGQLSFQAAIMADIAQRELAGQPLTEDQYWSIVYYGSYLQQVLWMLSSGPDEPDPVALVTDVANDGVSTVLQEGVGNVDLIYVVTSTPDGELQIVRGGVFSTYEFYGPIDRRMTDDEWRALVASGDLPPRPDWVGAFYSE